MLVSDIGLEEEASLSQNAEVSWLSRKKSLVFVPRSVSRRHDGLCGWMAAWVALMGNLIIESAGISSRWSILQEVLFLFFSNLALVLLF